VRRLGTLTSTQRRRHFHLDEFDVVCTGQMPYAHEDDFLSEFMGVDNGEQELVDTVSEWSSQTIKDRMRYVKHTVSSDNLPAYCVVEIRQSPEASRLFTISVELYGGSSPCDRLALLTSLKGVIDDLKDVEVLSKQMGQYLVGTTRASIWKKRKVEVQYHHASWDLVKVSGKR
jgi:hypothetical protein